MTNATTGFFIFGTPALNEFLLQPHWSVWPWSAISVPLSVIKGLADHCNVPVNSSDTEKLVAADLPEALHRMTAVTGRVVPLPGYDGARARGGLT
jgi:hypothetical protein